jgi:membrane protein required for colicin V production
MTFAIIDIVFGLITVGTFLGGLRKGFVANVMNKISWIFALIGACMLYVQVAVSLQSFVSNELLSKLLAFVIVFSAIYVVFIIVKILFSKIFSGNILGSLDTALGGLFGIIEGFAISFLIIYLMELQTFINVQPVLMDSFFRSVMKSVASQL